MSPCKPLGSSHRTGLFSLSLPPHSAGCKIISAERLHLLPESEQSRICYYVTWKSMCYRLQVLAESLPLWKQKNIYIGCSQSPLLFMKPWYLYFSDKTVTTILMEKNP